MQVTHATNQPLIQATMKAPERIEAPGPDHDGDVDNATTPAPASTASTPPTGMGVRVNTRA